MICCILVVVFDFGFLSWTVELNSSQMMADELA